MDCHLKLSKLPVSAAGVDPKQLELLAVEEQVFPGRVSVALEV